MKTKLIRTDEIYHRIIDTPTPEAKAQIYRQTFLAAWKPMMDMIAPGSNGDEFAGARAWHWLTPDDLDTVPDALEKLEAVNAWEIAADALEKAAGTMQPYADRIPIDTVTGWLMLADPKRADPIGRGYTGAIDFMQPQFVGQFDTPTPENLKCLPGLVVHEMHHLIRLRVFPWDMAKTSVADYIVHEGMAESFAAELFGEQVVGHYVTDFDPAALDTAKSLISTGLERTGFNVIRGYIFGDALAEKWGFEKIGMPTYGGYATGYHVVQAYLKRTGKSVAEATFVPADEIVRESGFFS